MAAQVSKAVAYAVVAAPYAVSKAVGYAVLSSQVDISVSKAVAYAVLAPAPPASSAIPLTFYVVT